MLTDAGVGVVRDAALDAADPVILEGNRILAVASLLSCAT